MKEVEVEGAGAVAGAGAAPPRGYRALVEDHAVAPAPPVSALEIGGGDRARFLHGQLTCDVKGLAPGRGGYGFLLTPKGRVLADCVVSAHGESLRLELPPAAAAGAAERLRRYVVADRVEIAAAERTGGALVAGPAAAAALARLLDGEPPAGWDHRLLDGEGSALRAEPRLGLPAWRLDGKPEKVGAWAAALVAAGAGEAAPEALEVVRVERGLPRAGVDYDDRHFPQETGLEEWAVSYTKGCYVGQEVVARIHYRGRANHRLCGLRSSPGTPPPAPGELRDADGEVAGELTSSVWSPAVGSAIGLAVLHRRWAEEGTRLVAAGGDELEVAPLPFVEPTVAPPPAAV